jgi:hypothetical protein
MPTLARLNPDQRLRLGRKPSLGVLPLFLIRFTTTPMGLVNKETVWRLNRKPASEKKVITKAGRNGQYLFLDTVTREIKLLSAKDVLELVKRAAGTRL